MKRRSETFQSSQARSSGKFKKSCGSVIHHLAVDDNDETDTKLVDLKLRKKITQSDYSELLIKGIVTSATHYICKKCIEYFTEEKKTKPVIEAKQAVSNESASVEDDEEENVLRFYELGRELSNIIKSDISEMTSSRESNIITESIKTMLDFKPMSWLTNRPNELIHLISNICDVDLNTASEKKVLIISKIIELIYFCRNSKLVLPIHLLENILCYSLTNCKTFSNFMASRSPGGSYPYLTNWFTKQASDPIKFPRGLAKAVFDNNQKIGKTYAITGSNIVPTSVMTSHLWIIFDNENTYQSQEEFKPEHWMWNNRYKSFKNELKSCLTETSPEFRDTRNMFLQYSMDIVYNQHKKDTVQDHIDESVAFENLSEKECIECGCEADALYRVCRNCGGNLTKPTNKKNPQKTSINPYLSFSDQKSTLPNIECTVGEPDFLNPNSFQTLIEICQNIGYRAGIRQYGGSEREWLFVECDGLPYNTIRHLIENVWRCKSCNKCFYGIPSFRDHSCYILEEIEPIHEFGWLVPISGLLHLEMNAARSFMKLNWEVFTSCLGHELGFKSPKAQEYLKKGSEHHKTWQFMEILYSSLALELVTPYVKDCIRNQTKPNFSGYWEWARNAVDPNYIYIQHMTLTYLHSLMMLRGGVRKCNAALVNDAKAKLAHLFFGRHHPIYQNILYQDTLDTLLMPTELREIKQKFVSGSRTNTPDKNQGGDALLEEVNKDSKSWCNLAGIPSEDHWLRVFRNLDDLNELKRSAFKTTTNTRTEKDFASKNSDQIDRVRVFIRKNEALSSPMEEREHSSIDGKIKLHENLLHFGEVAQENITNWIEARSTDNQEFKSQVVYVTASEYDDSNKVENLTKSQLKIKIFETIALMRQPEAELQEETFIKSVKNKCKEKYIEFYYKLVEILDQDIQISDSECD